MGGVASPKTNAPTGGEYKLEALLASRLGQGLALTVHRTVIHYQTPALRAARNEPDAGAPVDGGAPSPKTNAPTGGEYELEALLASRLGQGLALTVHWTVIHYQTPALRAARNEPGAGAPVDGGAPSPKTNAPSRVRLFLEAPPGIEPGMRVLQTRALPLGYGAIWSGKRGSNPPPQPWQGCALPNELFPHKKWCLRVDLNHRHRDFQSLALPTELPRHIGDPEGARTPDLQRDRLAY